MPDLDQRSVRDFAADKQALGEAMADAGLGVVLGATPLGVVVVEGHDGRAVYANEQAEELCGRPVLGTSVTQRGTWCRHADESPYSPQELPSMRALHGERLEAQEIELIQPNGRVRYLEVYATPVRAPSGEMRVVVAMWNVTRRKRAEQQLLSKVTELETALAALPDVYFRVDAAGTILDARSGRTSTWTVEPFIGKRLEEAFAPEAQQAVQRAMTRVRSTGSLATIELEREAGEGMRCHEVRILPMSPGELVLIVRDITELRRAQEQNRAREQRFHAIFDSAFQFIGLLDSKGTLLEANRTALDFAGVQARDVIGKPFWDTPWWDVSDAARAELKDAVQRAAKGEFVRYQAKHRRKDGQLTAVDFSLKPVRDERGDVVLLLPEGRDITDIEAARRALEESEERFRAAMENAPIGVALVDLDGRFLKVNCALCEIVGYSEAELLGLTFQQITHPDDVAMDVAQARELRARKLTHYHREKRYIHKHGHAVWAMLSVALVCDGKGEPRMFVAEIQDTTEQKTREAELRRSVAEKEVLLKEIHHRVKNNLQVISSMLRLQGQQSASAEVRAMFQDSQSRIQTMALIHDRLYQSANLANVDFAGLLRDLVAMLLRLFGGQGRDIRAHLGIEPLTLDLDKAIPLGLVANELLTNALKHAFRGRDEGSIHVTLTHRDASLTLTVADDGVGFPPDFDLRSSASLGMRMIGLLTHQLEGQLTLDRSQLNAISLTAPVGSSG